ncbi:MAG: SDR family oxidoreductase [Candidatus Melainabacteria bacterium]|nr:SDR family oxidoreductase [Candidatus Melainabacteria bacterium]
MNSSPKVVLVLGANGSLGSAVCRLLAGGGYKVVCAGRNKQAINELADQLGTIGIACDASDFASMATCFEEALIEVGRLDGLVNAVGSLHLKPAHSTTEEDWIKTIQTNLSSAFACVKYGARAMMANGGSIVLVSSAAAFTGMPNHEAIAAAKGGVASLSRAAAATYARHKIRVNCIAPGLMDTNLTRGITSNKTQLEASTQMHPLGRIGTPDDIAPAVEWLLSEKSSWVTGEEIKIDGGLSSLRGRALARAGS